MNEKESDTPNKSIDSLIKEIKILSEKVDKLEQKFKDKPSKITVKKADIRIVMLALSLIGLITTAIYLFYKG